ncbi:hypothetical protein GmHk_07G019848 [Glycine max]|nr:hypothetical protein GmHk_07G019848 [Glycine max]
MGEIEEVQEQMKADMEALKEQMVTMIEGMMSMKKIMEVNMAAVAATNVVAKAKIWEVRAAPIYLQIQNKHAFPPYGLPPNYTPPNVAYTLDEDVNNSAPILIESRQPHPAHVSQPMGETYEIPHHNLVDFKPCLEYATKGKQLVVYPCKTLWRALNFAPNHNPCIPQRVKSLLLWHKWESWII